MIDRRGLIFGLLTVKVEAHTVKRKSGSTRKYWVCRCECGQEKTVSFDNLASGKVTHCGCLSTRHYGYGTPLYGVWRRIKQCCTDPNYAHYKNYGARGITVCEDWANSFCSFRAWAEASGYKKGLSIERKNNDLGYTPDNCSWATVAEQNRNRRNTKKFIFNNQQVLVVDFAKEHGINYTTVLYRLAHNLDVLTGARSAI